MNSHNHLKTIISLCVTLAFVCFGLLALTQAVSPPPDGGYANGNTAEGTNALFSLTPSGQYNTAVGLNALYTDTTGGRNTATGVNALRYNVTGASNTAVGVNALYVNTANFNTAIGDSALFHNSGGNIGAGDANTATGYQALYSNIGSNYLEGSSNTADGFQALRNNTTGTYNTATGDSALRSNTTGSANTATGVGAIGRNTTGGSNTATGDGALGGNTTGYSNTAIGYGAGSNATIGSGNVYVGANVSVIPGESNRTHIRNIGSTPIIGGTTVVVVTGGIGDGVLGYASSSRRYKEDIQPMDKASETLFGLKPVTFRAKRDMDAARVKYYGLIAEDVAEVAPDLVVYNPEGKPETLRFESINAMLLNEFLKDHKTVEELEATVASLAATVREQATQIHKVSAQVEMGKATPNVVLNNP